MSWRILLNTRDGHYKYWSAQVAGTVYTGRIIYGRIGSSGVQHDYESHQIVAEKAAEKIASGYVDHEFSNSPYPSLASMRRAQEAAAAAPSIPRPRRASASSASSVPVAPLGGAYASRIVPDASGLRLTHNVPSVSVYKTNEKGLLPTYRSGYSRVQFEDAVSGVQIVKLASIVGSGSREETLAKQYYSSISATVAPIGVTFEQLRESHRPTYVFVFQRKSRGLECIGFIGIHKATGNCVVFHVKSNIQHRASITKQLMIQVAMMSVIPTIRFNGTPAMLREMKSYAPFVSSQTESSITYNASDLRTGIRMPQTKSERWID